MAMGDAVEVLAYIDIQHPAQSLAHKGIAQVLQRLMRRATRPEAIGAGQKVLLVDRLQHHDDRPLRHFVFKGRDAERPLRAVRLRDVHPAHRRRVITTGFDALQEIQQVGLQVPLVFRRRHAVDAGRPILARQPVGLLHPLQVDDVVQREQRCP